MSVKQKVALVDMFASLLLDDGGVMVERWSDFQVADRAGVAAFLATRRQL